MKEKTFQAKFYGQLCPPVTRMVPEVADDVVAMLTATPKKVVKLLNKGIALDAQNESRKLHIEKLGGKATDIEDDDE